MIWTAIFNDKSVKVFSTQYNSADDAKTYANKNFEKSLFLLNIDLSLLLQNKVN